MQEEIISALIYEFPGLFLSISPQSTFVHFSARVSAEGPWRGGAYERARHASKPVICRLSSAIIDLSAAARPFL